MSFDRLAPFYTWLEIAVAGGRLQRCRLAWLDALGGRENILIAGVGHGHFLAACAQRFPNSRITSVDASKAMLQHARRRAQATGADMRRLTFIHAALPEWNPPTGEFDTIVTHFFLDCFPPEELRNVIATLGASSGPGALWLLSDFAVPKRGLARHRARAVHALMYAFFRSVTNVRARAVTEPDGFLFAEGFQLVGRKSAEWGLLRADRWERFSRAEAA